MRSERQAEHVVPWQEAPAGAAEQSTTEECPLLLVDELEPRLNPDGHFPPPPPGWQVGWGC